MTNLFKDIPSGENPPENINVIVENIKGSKNKIEYEKQGFFKLDRTCYSPFAIPFEYGFIPQTHSEDGDSLDVILLATYPTFSGCVIKARPVGVLLMRDEAGGDNKIIAVPVDKVDPRFKEIKDIADVGEHLKKEIESFMQDYKKLEVEKYKHVKVEGYAGKEKAKELIVAASEKYSK